MVKVQLEFIIVGASMLLFSMIVIECDISTLCATSYLPYVHYMKVDII